MISRKKNLACKRKSTESPSTPSSTTDQQQQTRSPHSFEPSAEFKTRRDNLFKIMPQKPNLLMDRDFVALAQKLSETVDPVEFLDQVEENSSQLAVLEENGYDVGMLRERFDKLRRMSEDLKRSRETLEECEERRKDAEVKVCFTSKKLDALKKELELLKATVKAQRNEIETLESMEMSFVEDRNMILQDLISRISTLVEEEEFLVALLF